MVVAVFYEDDRVVNAVHRLTEIGFNRAEIDVEEESQPETAHEKLPKANCLLDGAVTGVTTGAIVGGIFGLLEGIGSLPHLTAQVALDIAEGCLAGVGIGAALGAALGCLAGWRMAANPKPQKKSEPVKSGVLVSVDAGPRDEEAKSALIESGGDLNPTNAADVQLL